MELDDTQLPVTGLEDDDNFLELVRQRARLQSKSEAIRLTQEVLLSVLSAVGQEIRRDLLTHMPQSIEGFVFPKLELDEVENLSLMKLERQIAASWQCDLIQAARLVGAVGLTISERVPHKIMKSVVMALPIDLQNIFQDKQANAA